MISEESIERLLTERAEEIAPVLWPGVRYLTGQVFDLERLEQALRIEG